MRTKILLLASTLATRVSVEMVRVSPSSLGGKLLHKAVYRA
ncbi:hypothetical protein [Microvirga ossetica]|nr:hypothetical protein [Microvirga ossetica]